MDVKSFRVNVNLKSTPSQKDLLLQHAAFVYSDGQQITYWGYSNDISMCFGDLVYLQFGTLVMGTFVSVFWDRVQIRIFLELLCADDTTSEQCFLSLTKQKHTILPKILEKALRR